MKHATIIILFSVFTCAVICRAYETSAGRAPFPEHGISKETCANTISALASLGVPGYANDHTSNKFTFFNVRKQDSFETREFSSRFIAGADFIKDDYSKLYGVTYYSNEFVKYSLPFGNLTVVGPCVPDAGHYWTGMAGHPDGTLYACSTSHTESKLYTINPDYGTPYLVGVVSNAPVLIALAINAKGDIYGLDIENDNLVLIDKTNPGNSIVVGNVGFNVQQSQGMDFDDKTGILYISAFNYTLDRAEIRVADLETGNTSLLYPVHNELYKLDFLAIATYAGSFTVPSVSCFAPNNAKSNLRNFLTDDPGMVVSLGDSVDFTAGADFLNGDYSKLYGVTYHSNTFVTISTNGEQTVIGPCAPFTPGQSWSGMAADPDGILYACSTSIGLSQLYTINPDNGIPTLVGSIENCPAIIDIAISPCGQMYGMDIFNDNLVFIDKYTGSSSILGFLDFNINFSQGMDFDDEHGLLYLAVINSSLLRSELHLADTNTGHTTFLGVIGDGLVQCDDIAVVSGAGSALKIYSLKISDKGPGKSSFSCRLGYNWPGKMPVTTLSLSLGNYSEKNIPVMPKGKKFRFENDTLKGMIDPQKHVVSFKARKIDPVGTTNPELVVTLRGSPSIYGQHRQLALVNGKYSENANLSNQLFYVDKAYITDSISPVKDKLALLATLNGKTAGANIGLTVSITGDNGVILTQTIAAADFVTKKDTLVYKRPKGKATPIKNATVSPKDKIVTFAAANFDMTSNALGTAMDPLVTITITADFTSWNGVGTVRIRCTQKSPGKAKF